MVVVRNGVFGAERRYALAVDNGSSAACVPRRRLVASAATRSRGTEQFAAPAQNSMKRGRLGRAPVFLMRKLANRSVWKRIFVERLTEPVHLNIIAAFVAVFGTTRAKIAFDLLLRNQHAFALLYAADRAKLYGIRRITTIEFGVANGAGLLNMCELASLVTEATGTEIDIVGFDSGSGMPEVRTYKDHPEAYRPGWYPMQDRARLESALPSNARLIIGEISQTLPEFLSQLSAAAPIGFVSLDVDYYWSTVEALQVFRGAPLNYLPMVPIYLDDVSADIHNPWCGELAAVGEFNGTDEMRKIGPMNFLRETRVFKNARWISQMYVLHVFDHPARFSVLRDYADVVQTNPYLPGLSDPAEQGRGIVGERSSTLRRPT